MASETSLRLWVGIFVAIPTAIPVVPLQRRNGNAPGKTEGSFVVSSKLATMSTVFFEMSETISSVILDILASVYR